MILNTTTSLTMVTLYNALRLLIIGVMYMTEFLGETATHVFEIEISERIKKETLEEFRAKLVLNKPKKGKKKKGKKKKKK